MVQSLTFVDCSSCGKRIRSNAQKCHYCHESNLTSKSLGDPRDTDGAVRAATPKKSASNTEDHDADSHMAADAGGYDQDADDFDYEEYLAEEFPDRAVRQPLPRFKRWVWVTAWVLIVATLMPYLYYVLVRAK